MKQHHYRVTLEYLADADGNHQQREPLVFEAGNHDEILGIVELLRSRELLDAQTTAAFVVGLKLFGEVMLENRSNPLFSDFWPHFLDFMKKLKGSVKQQEDRARAQPFGMPSSRHTNSPLLTVSEGAHEAH